MMDNTPDHQSLLEKIIEASTFGQDDLEFNRAGKMSGLQRSRLGLLTILYSSICIFLFSLAFGAIWVFVAQFKVVPFYAILVWVILCTFSGIHWLRQTLPMLKDVLSGTVLCISGPFHQIYTRMNIKNGSSIYLVHYRIAKKFFDIAIIALELIPENQKCHAYYAPKSGILVGIEPI